MCTTSRCHGIPSRACSHARTRGETSCGASPSWSRPLNNGWAFSHPCSGVAGSIQPTSTWLPASGGRRRRRPQWWSPGRTMATSGPCTSSCRAAPGRACFTSLRRPRPRCSSRRSTSTRSTAASAPVRRISFGATSRTSATHASSPSSRRAPPRLPAPAIAPTAPSTTPTGSSARTSSHLSFRPACSLASLHMCMPRPIAI
mmetsp:Transcript_26215/g.53987  ORF Transcript_26215/g.53987 Transcript_26215/m.53987 type:complete len:201 (+) Transcript_26215:812-1414(+)